MRVLSFVSDATDTMQPEHSAKNTFANSVCADSPSSSVSPPQKTGTNQISHRASASAIPNVLLEADVVTHNLAARLCTSFLGHVLFLKSQVPFPVVQLARMPGGDGSSHAAKKRQELINSFDTLASHLYTTFVALSTALAQRGTPDKDKSTDASAGVPHTGIHPDHGHEQRRVVDRVFLAIVLGPTIGAARTRLMVGIDGLEVQMWGLREDPASYHSAENDSESEGGSETDTREEDSSDECESQEGDAYNDHSSASDSSPEDEDDSESRESEELPPSSRSPSPAASSASAPSTLPSSPPPPPPPQVHTTSPCTSARLPTPIRSRSEEPDECALRSAERLLSRTLASACAEDNEWQGMASEMAPTQTHVTIRAPRRFTHPAWTPRQNLSPALDVFLEEFLQASGEVSNTQSPFTSNKLRKKGNKVEGVWIRSRANPPDVERLQGNERDDELAEEDEFIWWSWDGKLVGFTDW